MERLIGLGPYSSKHFIRITFGYMIRIIRRKVMRFAMCVICLYYMSILCIPHHLLVNYFTSILLLKV